MKAQGRHALYLRMLGTSHHMTARPPKQLELRPRILSCRTVHFIVRPNDGFDMASVTDRIFNSIMHPALISEIGRSIESNLGDHTESLFKGEAVSLLDLMSARSLIIFQEFDHDVWIPLCGVDVNERLQTKMLGDIPKAMEMAKRGLETGLAYKVELFLAERGKQMAETIYNFPTGLVSGVGWTGDSTI